MCVQLEPAVVSSWSSKNPVLQATVEAELRRERVEIEADPGMMDAPVTIIPVIRSPKTEFKRANKRCDTHLVRKNGHTCTLCARFRILLGPT